MDPSPCLEMLSAVGASCTDSPVTLLLPSVDSLADTFVDASLMLSLMGFVDGFDAVVL